MNKITESLDLESIKKIHWVTKEASERLPSSQVRLATPRLSGKIPGETHAKNPYGANKMKVKEVCGPKPIKPLTTKLASMGKEASDYYRRNRARILARNRAYRQKNKAMLAMKAKRYRMRVRSGAVRQRKRIHSGMGYTYAGY